MVSISTGAFPDAAEVHLNVTWVTASSCRYAPKGHVVAWNQMALNVRPKVSFRELISKQAGGLVVVDETADGLVVRAGQSIACFDREPTTLVSWQVRGVELLARGPLVELNRAATDNDGIKLWTGQDHKALGRWRKLGLIEKPLSYRPGCFIWKRNRDGSVTVTLSHAASGRENWSDCLHTHRYTMHADGSLVVDNSFEFSGDDMTDLPRVGVRFDLVAGYGKLAYVGLGPDENYRDRKAGSVVGCYETSVTEQYVDYVMPQEHGHHTEVRWLQLSGKDRAPALRITGASLFEFNASHFTAEDLYAAKHTTDLTPRAETIVYLDAAQRGLGTQSCGPDTLTRYKLLDRKYTLSFRLSIE